MTLLLQSQAGQTTHSETAPMPNILSRGAWRLRALTKHFPRPARSGLPDGPLVVAGMFRTGSGLGRSATACYEGLKADGWDPIPVCTSAILGQVDAPTDVPIQAMPKTGSGTLILHANAPETEIILHRLGLNRMKSWTIIGYWAWELPNLPRSCARESRRLSEVWVPSYFVKGAMEGPLACKIKVVPHRISVPEKAAIREVPRDVSIQCLVMADGRSSLARKNVAGAVELFRTAFAGRQDVRLVLKLRNLKEFMSSASDIRAYAAEDRRCELIDETLDKRELWALINRSDILMSCHRSEGFGLHLAEAMAMGRCVVATGWSGNMDFMTEHNSILLPYKMKPVEDPDKIYPGGISSEWAEVDVGAAAQRLRGLADNADLRCRLSQRARNDLQTLVSGNHYSDALKAFGRS